ncbi:MAG: CDP-alcohol phosphatidyltransferase, partial [Planctomycetota bacterium]
MTPQLFRFRAWCVHAYTGISIPFSFYSLIEIQRGNIQFAWILNLINVLIDSTDGTFARKFQVKKWLPDFDGGKLDDIAEGEKHTF